MRVAGRPRGRADYYGRALKPCQSKPYAKSLAAAAFGARLREVRTDHDVSAAELAAALGISAQTVFAWERGRSCVPLGELFRVALALGCTLDTLLEGLDQ